MEESNNAISSKNQEPALPTTTTASIVSAMTAVSQSMPITSDIDYFEPDSKWEMTTLEKASYDNNDIYTATNSLDNQPQEQRQQQQQQTQQENGKNHEVSSSERDHVERQPSQEHIDSVQSGQSEQSDLQKLNANTKGISTDICAPKNSDTSAADLHSPIDATATPPQPARSDKSDLIQSSNKQVTHCLESRDMASRQSEVPQIPQNPAIESQISEVERSSDGGTSNVCLSQSSVDAQMAKVIEDAIDLVGGHQFTQSLKQLEDREKAVEDIHREIVGCRSNPMNLIADVASKQPTLAETHARPNPQGKHDTQANNSMTPDGLVSSTDLKTTREIVPRGEENFTASPAIEISERSQVDNRFQDVDALKTLSEGAAAGTSKREVSTSEEASSNKHVTEACSPRSEGSDVISEASKNELKSDPIQIEHSPAQSEDDNSVEQLNCIVEEVIEVIEKPTATTNEAAQIHNEQPKSIVEQAPSADESEKNDTKEDNPNSEKVESPPELKSPEHADSRSLTRRSSRKVKPTEKISEEEPIVDSSSRRVSGRARKTIKVTDSKEIEPKKKLEEPVASVSTSEFEKSDCSKQEGGAKEVESAINEEKVADEGKGTKRVVRRNEKQVRVQIAEEVASADEISPEPQKQARSMRTRTPKRSLEEDSPSSEPRKQIKMCRGVSDELNKSFEVAKNTPIIKLPFKSSRATISTSDPASRPDPHHQQTSNYEISAKGRFQCNDCKYSTDRLNNIVFHYKEPSGVSGIRCPGVSRRAQEQMENIIKLQQTPKGNKRKHR